MNSITVNENLSAVLRQITEVVEVPDLNGKLIGYFAPVGPERHLYPQATAQLGPEDRAGGDLEDLRADFDLAEIERRFDPTAEGFPLSEVYEHLKTLTPSPETRSYLQKKIDALGESYGLVEVRAPDDSVMGFFAPATMQHARLYARAAARIDPEEIKRRKESGGRTYTTQEVLDHLRSLETG
jgi:hypothetical protein